MKKISKSTYIILFTVIALTVVSSFFFYRIDLTSDKRYSISKQTKTLMKSVREPVTVTIYLTGDLNPGFLRLKKSVAELLDELSAYAEGNISINYVNPSEAETNEEREQKYAELEQKGMTATSVYDKDKEGKNIQKIIFPWLEISYKGKTIPVNLLKNIRGISGEENLNISVENLEFELTDAIRRLVNTKVEKIAFLEGHGELNETETYDISRSLSRYFQIDRGIIDTDPNILNDYKALIIAKPMGPFSEKDKFVIDQYVMHGGRVLWLIDGVRVSEESLTTAGISPAIELDLNLNDILFRYGVRISPVLVQDVQSVLVPVNVAAKGQQPDFQPMPWVNAPLLLTSGEHPVTRNLAPVKANFASAIEIVGDDKKLERNFILASSDNTHILQTPAEISLLQMPDLKDKKYFNNAYVPVGVVLEGEFQSDFSNRMAPKEIVNPSVIQNKSVRTRQIIIADGDIIRNETEGTGENLKAVPLGYDRYMNQQFANNELITNAVLYLTDQSGWMELRSKTVALRLLNKKISASQKTKWQIINVVIPPVILIIFGILVQWTRRRRYTR
ncbi:MAG TPA: gliding motility-associated ABC transporter substrate-binding protein GldG [Paludibacteraceae bacterium]|nr:gliding motility-associated ABC transporter substrate-binding protein GldG [Paludibacteraceae bacterium]HPT42319.1 gliding motility-associated ABC transporter substrate-binding protein GldG [Paludibacteraceae bacterium]